MSLDWNGIASVLASVNKSRHHRYGRNIRILFVLARSFRLTLQLWSSLHCPGKVHMSMNEGSGASSQCRSGGTWFVRWSGLAWFRTSSMPLVAIVNGLVIRLGFAFSGLLAAAGVMADTTVSPSLTFAVVPQQSATRLAEEWGPLLAEIGRRAGVQIVFRTAPTIPAFEERLAKGAYDLAYMNPYHYVVFNKVAGYQALAREKNRKITGIVVVRADSVYRVLAELAGKSVAFPAPAAFAASILPQAEFARLRIPVEAKYVSSHDSVYLAVAAGLHEAGGGIRRTFEAAPAEVRAALRVLAETPPYMPHAIAVHPRVNKAVAERLLAAMVALDGDQVGRKLLAPLSFNGITAARDADWNDIRALDIRLLERLGKP